MIPGIEITLGGTTYVVPPLSLAAIEALQDRLEAFTGGVDRNSVRTVVDATHAALRRNYPDLARETVAEGLDVANMGDVMAAVMDVAGLRRKELEEKKAAAASLSTGESSTPT